MPVEIVTFEQKFEEGERMSRVRGKSALVRKDK